MKIEMGESLFYSWLRHVKECQIVQTNWKVSPQWILSDEEKLETLMDEASSFFNQKYGYEIFKKNASLSQIIRQSECDAIGISVHEGVNQYFAVDVAFHKDGLNYLTRSETVMKVIAKSIRTAICIHGFFQAQEAEIIFASPKIQPAILNDLTPCINDVNQLFAKHNLNYTFRLIANDDFNSTVLQPILLMSNGIADTSELFIRSYQMFTMFATANSKHNESPKQPRVQSTKSIVYHDTSIYKELKVGQIAQTVLRRLLEQGAADENELTCLQDLEYCKKTFHLNYPLLVNVGKSYDRVRYYANSLTIRGTEYVMCSQWVERPENNDRPYLIKWIEEHSTK